MKKISIAVTDFAVPSPMRGSIDVISGFGRASQAGQLVHQRVQADRMKDFPRYKSEVETSYEFAINDYLFAISGRIDGVFQGKEDGNVEKIEEIKSSFNVYDLFKKLKSDRDHPYCLQLKTYGYFHYKKTGQIPKLNLHLVSTRNGDTKDLDLRLDIDAYEDWLVKRLAELVSEVQVVEKRIKRRKKAAEDLKFPFENPRAGQWQLIDTIKSGMQEKRPLLLQAPTGLGKTVGVLFPAMKEALSRGQKTIYVTPKNSQHAVAEDAVERLQNAGAAVRAMTITAKSKMCLKNEPLCNPDYCEYARDHYTKVSENKLIGKLSKKKNLGVRTFKNMAEEFQVCPFELQLAAAQTVDAVICDYNYVFAPRTAFGRIAAGGLGEEGKPNLIIDEAHNLPHRSMDYYSPQLSTRVLEKMREEVDQIPARFQNEAKTLIDQCIEVVKKCGPQDCAHSVQINPPITEFMNQDVELRNFLSTYLSADVDIQPGDVVMRLSFYWSEFTNNLGFVASGRQEFFTTFTPYPPTVKIVCCDASEMLKNSYDEFANVMGFSATLKPFNYYAKLSGLEEKNFKTAEFASPFPKERRKLLVIPQISSKYSDRERSYPKIAEAIEKITRLKRGNYFAFFPSFDFLEKVLRLFSTPHGFDVVKQERGMIRSDIEYVFDRLKDKSSANIVFAVQGGVFSEGVDYPGEMAIGAFVVGPPLPIFDLEREKMRQYYEERYGAGFDYAYAYPAMAKAVQAAGRVIRSETDSGIIILIDNRFIQPNFAKSMPDDWFDEDPRELTSTSILGDVEKFWRQLER